MSSEWQCASCGKYLTTDDIGIENPSYCIECNKEEE